MKKSIRIAAAAGAFALLALTAGVVSAEDWWPTPPPGPFLPPPSPVPASQITSVPAPSVSGSATIVLQPVLPPQLPRVPPLAAVKFVSTERDAEARVHMTVESASLSKTLQLRYQPLNLKDVPAAGGAMTLVSAFQLETFDAKGGGTDPELRRPWVLMVPVPRGANPDHLLLAQYDSKKERWLPLLTSYRTDTRLLVTRIATVGRFAVVSDARPLAP